MEAAARWLAAVPDTGSYADRTGEQDGAAEASAEPGAGEQGDWGGESDRGEGDRGEGTEGTGRSDAGQGSSAEHLCRGCPWCRAKAAAGPIGADTLDSIAHLLSAAAESLSLFAQSRRDAQHDHRSDNRTADNGSDDDSNADDSGSESHTNDSDDSEGAAPWA